MAMSPVPDELWDENHRLGMILLDDEAFINDDPDFDFYEFLERNHASDEFIRFCKERDKERKAILSEGGLV
jgi:hypothetical protein